MKNNNSIVKLLASIVLIFELVNCGYSQTVNLRLSGIRNNSGVIQLTIYNNPESYKKEVPEIYMEIGKDSIINGKMSIKLNLLSSGIWGIAAIDDENSNGKIDYRFFIPKEGFGFSNHQFEKRCKPNFDEFSFPLENEEKDVEIEMYYF